MLRDSNYNPMIEEAIIPKEESAWNHDEVGYITNIQALQRTKFETRPSIVSMYLSQSATCE